MERSFARRHSVREAIRNARLIEILAEQAKAKREGRRLRWLYEWGNPRGGFALAPAMYGIVRANKKH